jgi:8-oxo-dGTP pyrophosphatase MutT (NUDIX family)
MAELWVFPGGRMEGADASPEVLARMSSLNDREGMLGLDGRPIERERALALQVAACRETFEESGLLLARRHGGGTLDIDAGRLSSMRAEVAADASRFAGLLLDEDLLLDGERLVYWSHWITPSAEKKRFDTRFFAIPVPEGQVASVDRSELTQHAWLTEAEIRDRMSRGDMKLAPPTIATLEDLWHSHASHGGLAPMLEAERWREVPPILPKGRIVGDGTFEILLPWDREYASAPGEGCVTTMDYPRYLQRMPSRRLFKR